MISDHFQIFFLESKKVSTTINKRHIFFIDDLKKLEIKKDSSLMLASTAKDQGREAYFLFEKDFYISNIGEITFRVHDFKHAWKQDAPFHLQSLELTSIRMITLSSSDCLHMRIDPPFDGRYLRYLWMLSFLESRGIQVLNSAQGILKYNEKLKAIEQADAIPSFIGGDPAQFERFTQLMKDKGYKSLILKPLDLYQGIGVVNYSLDDPHLSKLFIEEAKKSQGIVIAQPLIDAVYKGEVRSIYYAGKELGSILKTPKDGAFLANIARGASYAHYQLTLNERNRCDLLALELQKQGVLWIAFDILGGHVSEVNITCPGLLVEVSHALHKNLSLDILSTFDDV